jgi:hypothetical protein
VAARGRRRVAASGESTLIAALPAAAAFLPGSSLAGVRLGEPASQVRAHLGRDYGVCRDCATTTWYFTYRRFDDRGLGVELTGGRVSAVYTLWQPPGWHTATVRLGDAQAKIGTALTEQCSGYDALVRGTSVFYVVNGDVWGFGLIRKGRSPCR